MWIPHYIIFCVFVPCESLPYIQRYMSKLHRATLQLLSPKGCGAQRQDYYVMLIFLFYLPETRLMWTRPTSWEDVDCRSLRWINELVYIFSFRFIDVLLFNVQSVLVCVSIIYSNSNLNKCIYVLVNIMGYTHEYITIILCFLTRYIFYLSIYSFWL